MPRKTGVMDFDEPGSGRLVFPNIYSARKRPRFTGIIFEGPSRTHQEFEKEVNKWVNYKLSMAPV